MATPAHTGRSLALAALLLALNVGAAWAQSPAANPMFALPSLPKKDVPPNTVTESISREARQKMMQSMMMTVPLSTRELIAMLVYKVKAQPGLKFNDVVESMKLRANQRNFKFVGSSPLSKDVEATTGKPSPKVEVFNFCDSLVARKMLDYAPELIAFLPCRIAVLEDAQAQIWLMTLDWDIAWMSFNNNPNNMSDELKAEAAKVRDILNDIMTAGANGDL